MCREWIHLNDVKGKTETAYQLGINVAWCLQNKQRDVFNEVKN